MLDAARPVAPFDYLDDEGSRTTNSSWSHWRKVSIFAPLLMAASVLLVIGGASPASANSPAPPNPGEVQQLGLEPNPVDCPAGASPAGTIPSGLSANALCWGAVNNAPTVQAASAIRYAFSKLGAPYSQSNRFSVNPPVFDCSSFVARAYDSADAAIVKNGQASTWISRFGWTGAYVPGNYVGSNLFRIAEQDLRAGDVIIYFAGDSPANSAGNAGHAQIYIGNGRIIESSGPVGVDDFYSNPADVSRSFNNVWYFRYAGTPKEPTIDIKHKELGGVDGVAGPAIGPIAYDARGFWWQEFRNATIYLSPSTGVTEVHGAIRERYKALGGPSSVVGLPISDETTGGPPGSRRNVFQNGAIYWSPNTGAQEIYGLIWNRYRNVGAATSPLGLPITGEESGGVSGARRSLFQNGAVYWSASTGAGEVYGQIWQRYKELGMAVSPLGLPTSGETSGPLAGSRLNSFQRGGIYWSATTGAHDIYGAIYARYASLSPQNLAGIGLPTSGEKPGPFPGSRMNTFQRGGIYWSATTGAHDVYGEIHRRYASLSPQNLAGIGLPTTGEKDGPLAGSRMNSFQRGGIYWSATTGAHDIYGDIAGRYMNLSPTNLAGIGLPTSGETNGPLPGSRMNSFQRGGIYWSATTGAHDVYGEIHRRYGTLSDSSRARLGLPVSGEQSGGSTGSRRNVFQNGSIYWSPNTGAHEITGELWAKYQSMGGASSFLGLPVASVKSAGPAESLMSTLQGGAIFWSAATGANEVHGAIWAQYSAMGAGTSALGLPTSDEIAGPQQGSRLNNFQRGRIVWSPVTGTAVY